jgi:antitoxin (DNA-binding transcriptional repressor) of toxin-antitoxin stability system
MKTAGIRELKAHLSSYLQGVQRGEALLITDRGRVVAEVRPPGAGAPVTDLEAHRRALVVEKGVLRPAPAPEERSWATFSGLGLPKGSAQAILDAERGE